MSRHRYSRFVGIVSALTCASGTAFAADTVETWSRGASDFEFYLGYVGLGAPEPDRTVFGDVVLGYGIIQRLSAYVGTTFEGQDALGRGSSTRYAGVFGTPLDTGHVDLDLFMQVSEGGPQDTFELRPAFELNLDGTPEMRTWGIYLRVPFPIYGRKLTSPLHPDDPSHDMTWHIESTLGAYVMAAEGHQILVQHDMGIHPEPAPGERQVDVGGLAAGYNVILCDGLELINEARVDIPQGGEPWSVGMMTGFIGTLPSAK